jgi:hypothetical protein
MESSGLVPACNGIILHIYCTKSEISYIRNASCSQSQRQFRLAFWKYNLNIDMDISYTRVLHIKVAYRVPHK